MKLCATLLQAGLLVGTFAQQWRELSREPVILHAPSFLSELEVEQLLLLGASNASGGLRPSGTTNAETGRTSFVRAGAGSSVPFRASQTLTVRSPKLAAFFEPLRRRMRRHVEQQLGKWFGAGVTQGLRAEPLQLQRYDPGPLHLNATEAAAQRGAESPRAPHGGYYALHNDVMRGIGRRATVMLYLTTHGPHRVMAGVSRLQEGNARGGGATVFARARPRVGAKRWSRGDRLPVEFDAWSSSEFAAPGAGASSTPTSMRFRNGRDALALLNRLCAMPDGALNGTLLKVAPGRGAALMFFPAVLAPTPTPTLSPSPSLASPPATVRSDLADPRAVHGSCPLAAGDQAKWIALQWFA